jgi:hypothetical protein
LESIAPWEDIHSIARGRELDALRAMRAANYPDEAQRMLAAELPEGFAAVLQSIYHFPGR